MPSTSKAQAKTMLAACKNKAFSDKVKIPQGVACEFHAADKAKGTKMKDDKTKKYAKGGSVSSRADGIARKGRTKTKYPKMGRGGSTMGKGC